MSTPTFASPPVVELAIGVQFSPVANLTAAHYGRFWQALGPELWPDASDGPPLDYQFETFDPPARNVPAAFQLQAVPMPYPGRVIFRNATGDRVVQLQRTRLHLNWRKSHAVYPSYKTLIGEFESVCDCYRKFLADKALGELLPNQWELTYVDAFPRGELWQSPADWPRFVPGLFTAPPLSKVGSIALELDHRAAEWSYELTPKLGRLHVHAYRAPHDGADSLMLTMTARGPAGPGGSATLREGLDLGHDAALGAFLAVTASDEQKRWGGA